MNKITASATKLRLANPGLLRQQAYVAGAFVDADGGAKIEVNNPATGQPLGTRPEDGRRRNGARHRGGRGGAAGLARPDRPRSVPRSCAAGST